MVEEVHIFENEAGKPGQLQVKSRSDVDHVRRSNAMALTRTLARLTKKQPLHAMIGQMWNFSMPIQVLESIRREGIRVVNISMDDRHSFLGWRLADGRWSGTCGLMGGLDLACTAAPECVPWYEIGRTPALYLPEASDPDLFRVDSSPKLYDVCFVGARYGVRERMVGALQKEGITVQAYGDGWARGRLPTDSIPRLFAQSKIVLGCGTILHCEDFYALKMRDFDGPMSGSLYMTHDNPDLYELFVPNREIVLFRKLPEMIAKVKYYLGHDEEREQIARAGQVRAARDHTWQQRFQALMTKLELL